MEHRSSFMMSDDRGIGLKGWLTGQRSKVPSTEGKPETVILEKNRIAVLPLANFTSDPGDEYFADGMTEELVATLAKVSGFRVISRTSVMQYKNSSRKLFEIGRDLGAGSIIEGSVRKAGNHLRISVQLIDAQEDRYLWGETYERELGDIFAVQADIARNVSDALKIKLLPAESARLDKNATTSMEAYTLYLKGRQRWNRRDRESNEKAIECFQSSIDLDSRFALAYAGLADCYNVAAEWGFMPAGDAYSKAKESSQRALELDPHLGEAHASMGWTLFAEWNWSGAETEYKRAIEFNPNYASARQWYSELLSGLGRWEEALVEAQKASETDPLSPKVISNEGDLLGELGKYDLAAERFQRALDIRPDFVNALVGLAFAKAKGSKCAEALNACQKLEDLRHSDMMSRLTSAYVYAVCGREDDARELLLDCTKNLDAKDPFLSWAAWAYIELNEKNKAIELLQRGYESHNPSLHAISSARFDELSTDPRFIELQRKMGMRQ